MAAVSDLRSQLLANFGGTAPEPEAPAAVQSTALSPDAHRDTEWFSVLKAAVRGTGIKLNPNYKQVDPEVGTANESGLRIDEMKRIIFD